MFLSVPRSTRIPLAISRALHMASNPVSKTPGPVESSIQTKLANVLQPTSMKIVNDSWQHRHHAAMRAQGDVSGETHFTVHIVSNAFDGKSTMQRHRMVYSALSEELAQGLHSLSLKTKTETEAAAEET